MIILDTNVLSALMRAKPDVRIVVRLDQQAPPSIWITAITVFEAHFGIALLPSSRRRQAIELAFSKLLTEDLEGRVLDFDAASAAHAAILAAERQRAGRPVDFRDTQIAGIALARRATLATRNVTHFEGLSVPVINPWET
ncbi:MAG: type II toxin-antitoxin system VapC family toxin [Candidatus Binataceae bacterium]